MTDTRLNVPFLPRRILSYRTPDGHPGAGHVYFAVPPAGCDAVLGGLVVVLLIVSIGYDVATGQLVARIPDYLMLLGALGILTVLRWRLTGHPE